jgi:hypothetical protein
VAIWWILGLLWDLWRRFVGKGMGCQELLFERVLGWITWIVPGLESAINSNCMGLGISITFSAFPLTPTNVPLLVYSFCEADNETDKREYGAPRTSNRASTVYPCISRLYQTISETFPDLQDPSTHQLSFPEHLQ